MKLISIAGALLVAMVGQAMALDTRPYVGSWSGTLGDGKPVTVSVPPGVTDGQSVGYTFDNEDQGPQTATAQGQKLRLDNPSGSYILLGPVKRDRIKFYWTNGSKSTTATLVKN